jgi:hypothetical protein
VIDDPALDVYERAIYEQIRRRDWHGAGQIVIGSRWNRDPRPRGYRRDRDRMTARS